MRVTKINNLADQAEAEYRAAKAAQTVADIEYIAMMTGIDIFEDESEIQEAMYEQDVQ